MSNKANSADGKSRTADLQRYTITGLPEVFTMEQRQKSKIESGADAVALYHVIYKHEGFEESAQNLFKLVQNAQRLSPDKKRMLHLDIEGHRVEDGGFDADMLELQKEFLLSYLSPSLSEIHCPLVDETNLKPQENDIPPSLILIDGRNEEK